MGIRLPPPLEPDAHKGSAGRVLAIAGSRLMPGAAVLVARAAQRAGAGLVRMACLDAELLQVIPAAAPEAVLLELTEGGTREAIERCDAHALLCGPGLGEVERTRAVVRHLLAAGSGIPRVLDADALNVLAGEPEALLASAGPIVVTPHPGEAERLLARRVPREDDGRRAFAEELARRAGAVVCLKGRHTVVTDGERTFVNDSGNPGLATAGAGDVLAGILAAYLAREVASGALLDVQATAAAAVHVHGLAGDLAARAHGRRALIASDVVDAIGAAQLSLEDA